MIRFNPSNIYALFHGAPEYLSLFIAIATTSEFCVQFLTHFHDKFIDFDMYFYSLLSYSMALGAVRPPQRPPEGEQGGGGRERVREGTTVQYRVSFPTILTRLRCPVEGCGGSASSQTNLRVHFDHRHSHNSIVILEEGNQPHPWCPQYGREGVSRRIGRR